jgi:hypothetical protein
VLNDARKFTKLLAQKGCPQLEISPCYIHVPFSPLIDAVKSKEEAFLVAGITSNACFVVSKSYWCVREDSLSIPCLLSFSLPIHLA